MKFNLTENGYPENYKLLRMVFESHQIVPKEFLDLLDQYEYTKGDYLQNESIELKDVIFILEGSIRVFERTESIEKVHRLLGRGDVYFDYSAAAKALKSRLIVQSSSSSVVLRMNYEALLSVSLNSPIVREFLIQLASKSLCEEIEHRSLLSGVQAVTRINVVKSLFPHLITRFTQRDLSSYLGMAVESYNRLYHQI